jgi:predicted extracellular nuclease
MARAFLFLAVFGLFSLAARGQVVINEIHHNPDVNTQHYEFIELYNAGSTAVDLSGWSLEEAVMYQFPSERP